MSKLLPLIGRGEGGGGWGGADGGLVMAAAAAKSPQILLYRYNHVG